MKVLVADRKLDARTAKALSEPSPTDAATNRMLVDRVMRT